MLNLKLKFEKNEKQVCVCVFMCVLTSTLSTESSHQPKQVVSFFSKLTLVCMIESIELQKFLLKMM